MAAIYTVSQLNNEIKDLLDAVPGYRSLLVQGEISNYKAHSSGHHYMTLKDRDAAINAVMFRSDAMRLKFRLENGMKVIVRARVSSFPRTGAVQLYISEIIPDGAGALNVAFEQLKAKLAAEGLFAESRKKPIPSCPMSIALVTSPTGAAVRDMIRILGRRWPLAKVVLYPAQVQGQGAAESIARALALANAIGEADVILCGRGGGSMEDLWAFNEEVTARAIYASEIPVISAVGHEPDVTIADFVADLRAPTPSGAAELAVPDRADWKATLEMLDARLRAAAGKQTQMRRRQLQSLSERLSVRTPVRYIAEKLAALRGLDTDELIRLTAENGAGPPACSRQGKSAPRETALHADCRVARRDESAARAEPRLCGRDKGRTGRGRDRCGGAEGRGRAAHPICKRRGRLPRDPYRGGTINGGKDV